MKAARKRNKTGRTAWQVCGGRLAQRRIYVGNSVVLVAPRSKAYLGPASVTAEIPLFSFIAVHDRN